VRALSSVPEPAVTEREPERKSRRTATKADPQPSSPRA